jgi:hypothetical protein
MSTVKLPGFTGERSLYKTSGQYRSARSVGERAAGFGVLPQLPVWTTDTVCEACGCTVSGFQCNCGLRPDPKKLECIKNGGPSKVITPIFGGIGIGGGIFSRTG